MTYLVIQLESYKKKKVTALEMEPLSQFTQPSSSLLLYYTLSLTLLTHNLRAFG